MLELIIIVIACFVVLPLIKVKNLETIKHHIVGIFSNTINNIKDDINTITGKRDSIVEKREKIYKKCVSISGDINQVKYEKNKLENELRKTKQNYRNKLEKLESGDNSISKHELKSWKETIEQKENILNSISKRLEKLESTKSELSSKINLFDLKIRKLDCIIDDIKMNKNIKSINKTIKEGLNNFDIDKEMNNFDEVISDAERINEKYKGENEFEEEINNQNIEDEDITIDELRL